MKKFSTLLTAIAAVAAISAPAVAADMRMPMKAAPPPVVAVFNWTGFYIGGFVGGAVSDRNAVSSQPCNLVGCYNATLATQANNSYDLGSSFIGGGTLGYNWQPVGSNFVLGIEGEVGYLRMSKSVVDVNGVNIGLTDSFDQTTIGDWYGVIAGRAGIAFDRVLLYAKGGVAFVDKSYSFTDTCTVGVVCGPLTLSLVNSDTQVTWAAGAGVEWAFAPNWSLKGEYLYIDTRETYTQSGVASNGVTFSNSHTDPGTHTGKFGVNYRF